MTAAVREVASARELAAQGWDELLGAGDAFVSSQWLRAVELLSPRRPYYLVVGEAPVRGGLSGYLVGGDERVLSVARPDRLLDEPLARAGLSEPDRRRLLAAVLPTLSCGARQVGYSRIPARGSDALRALLAETSAGAARHGARSVSLNYVSTADTELREALQAEGFAAFPVESAAVLDVPEDGFDGYLKTLSRKRRTSVRRERQRVAEAGVRIEVGWVTAELADRLAPLQGNLLRKHGEYLSEVHIGRSLRTIARVHGDDLPMITAWLAGAVVGFAVFARWRDELYPLNVGFDYAAVAGLPVYFELLFYAAVDYAAGQRVRIIDYGCGALPGKLHRGCRLSGRVGYLRCLDPSVQRELLAATTELAALPALARGERT
jgi:predicted N-acyltransferase